MMLTLAAAVSLLSLSLSTVVRQQIQTECSTLLDYNIKRLALVDESDVNDSLGGFHYLRSE